MNVIRWCWLVAALHAGSSAAAVYTVTNVADAGAGSLRQALLDANANPGLDEIHFNIPGSGVHAIAVASTLPGISSPVVIDGYTQPGSAVNTAGLGTNAQLRIEVRPGSPGTSGGFILLVGSGGSTIRGLVVNSFAPAQITVTAGSSDCVVSGNFIGTDATGTIGYPGSPLTRSGLSVSGDRCRIGGPVNADRNLVSGLSNIGIYISGDDDVVQGNLVGTTASGGLALGNSVGISVGATNPGVTTLNALIGGLNSGSTQVPRNVVSGNSSRGIEIVSGQGHRILGNIVGLAAFPIVAIPNAGAGIRVSGGSLHDIGTPTPGGENAIVGNLGPGVLITGPGNDTAPQGVWVVGNSIFNNSGLAIDLAVNGVEGTTANDALDADVGANSLQNFPELTQVIYSGGQTALRGRLRSAPNQGYSIALYTVVNCDSSGHGGGGTYLGTAFTTANAAGDASFEFSVPSILDTGFATATASRTVDLATSEFSACLVLGDVLFANGFEASMEAS